MSSVILLDWSGVDLTPQSTPYAEEAVELQDSNMTPDQIYTINSKSWQKIRKRKNVPNQPQITRPLDKLCDLLPQSPPQRQYMALIVALILVIIWLYNYRFTCPPGSPGGAPATAFAAAFTAASAAAFAASSIASFDNTIVV